MFEWLRDIWPLRTSPRFLNLENFTGTVYVIGDVHGRLDLLLGLEALIFEDAKNSENEKLIIYIGDMIDRGPDSAGVLTHIRGPVPTNFLRLALLGNHEHMLLRFVQDTNEDMWLNFGGRETLMSYGVGAKETFDAKPGTTDMRILLQKAIPRDHLNFLHSLPQAIKLKHFILTHAGGDPEKSFADQTKRDMVWGVRGFLKTKADYGQEMVHGHFIVDEVRRADGKIAIDTGAYTSGRLSAVKLEHDGTVEFLQYEIPEN
jgi:serine/threonine protein phosphatase 1